jgi:hypothetical protein
MGGVDLTFVPPFCFESDIALLLYLFCTEEDVALLLLLFVFGLWCWG